MQLTGLQGAARAPKFGQFWLRGGQITVGVAQCRDTISKLRKKVALGGKSVRLENPYNRIATRFIEGDSVRIERKRYPCLSRRVGPLLL